MPLCGLLLLPWIWRLPTFVLPDARMATKQTRASKAGNEQAARTHCFQGTWSSASLRCMEQCESGVRESVWAWGVWNSVSLRCVKQCDSEMCETMRAWGVWNSVSLRCVKQCEPEMCGTVWHVCAWCSCLFEAGTPVSLWLLSSFWYSVGPLWLGLFLSAGKGVLRYLVPKWLTFP